MKVIHSHLPHFDKRPENTIVDTIVIHSLYADGYPDPFDPVTCKNILDQHTVSAHYLIASNGDIYQLVKEECRAWHAGVSKMPFPDDSRENVNEFSIGIELIGKAIEGFTDAQYNALSELTAEILRRHPIKNIVGHDHIAPIRKTDPGPLFDWKKYKRLVRVLYQRVGNIKFAGNP